MLQYFMNPLALTGLLGVSLAVIAHLISRRRFDVVQWGAMQFLNPARKTRRKLKLEELLLMLIRMSMIALLVMAVTRPWLPSGLFSGYRSMGSRAIVLVIDGSNSMTRGDGLNTLHQNAKRRAAEFLETLGPGDSVSVIDARDQPRLVVESPLQDLQLVKKAIDAIPDAGGSIDVRTSVEQAIAVLSKSSASAREIVLLTDRQRAGWDAADDASWARIEDLMTFPTIKPRFWSIDVSQHLAPVRQNIAIGKIELPRDLTVPGFPVRLNTRIHNSGADDRDTDIRLLLNGQPLAEHTQKIRIPGQSAASVEFEVRLNQVGTQVLSVAASAADDAIQADDVSHCAIIVTTALPVLLVNGRPSLDPFERETFFVETALGASEETPWISAKTVDQHDVTQADIDRAAMVILADVVSLPEGIASYLAEYASRGNGIFISPGPQTNSDNFQELFGATGLLAGVKLDRLREAPPDDTRRVHVDQNSLQTGWLSRFRSDTARSFLTASYEKWWLSLLTEPIPNPLFSATNSSDPPDATDETSIDLSPTLTDPDEVNPRPNVLISLTTGDPLLLQCSHGEGNVLLFNSSLTRQWNNLPTTADFVPFLYEAVLQSASSRIRHNVEVGAPLMASAPPQTDKISVDLSLAGFVDPSREFHAAEAPKGNEVGDPSTFLLSRTWLPGVYDFVRSSPDATGAEVLSDDRLDRFVVNYDHAEDDFTELTADDRGRLRVNDRVRFVDNVLELAKSMYGDESRTELWAILIFLFPCFLLLELFVTRRLIRSGYSQTADKTN
ncbi:MAG: BatA and WFA domain-containing protein [Planctomycetaceae bacterium]|nr:BatA and WFA domain-containing protein [Planctomycetaceae bacterium]